MTIRDLLSHQTGPERGDPSWFGTDFDRDEILRRARYLQQDWSFRSGFIYSNIMYLAAGEFAARVAGKSWDDLIQDRIFTPLGMDRSNTSIRKNTAFTDIASPHGLATPPTPISWQNNDNIGPAGSINSNAVGMTALIWLVPEERFGMAILTNRLGTNLTTALAYRITDLLPGGARGDWSAEYLAFTAPARAAQAGNQAERNRIPDTKPSLALEKYAGVYERVMYGQITVDVRDGKLMIRRGARIEGPLEHWHFDVFRAAWTDRTLGRPFVTFLIDPQARVQSLRIHRHGRTHPERVIEPRAGQLFGLPHRRSFRRRSATFSAPR